MSIREFKQLLITHNSKEFIFHMARIKKVTTEELSMYGSWIIQEKLNPTKDNEVIQKARQQVKKMNQDFEAKYGKHPTAIF